MASIPTAKNREQRTKNKNANVDDAPTVDFAGTDLNTSPEVDDFSQDYPEDYADYSPQGFIDSDQLNISNKREDTRGRLAIIYTVSTFIVFLLGFIVSILDAQWRQTSIIDNLTKILPLLSGIFLGTLGFVLGYYFRKGQESEN